MIQNIAIPGRIDLALVDPVASSGAAHVQITFGNVSVWAFFVISGFLIAQSWTRSPKPLKFMKRRVARIYPGFTLGHYLRR